MKILIIQTKKIKGELAELTNQSGRIGQLVEQGEKEVQCSKIKSNGERCKMKTKAKSGLCYYHD